MDYSINHIQCVYQMLEDDESRFTYLNRLNYLITDDFSFMDEVISKYLPELPKYGSKGKEQFLAELPVNREFVLFGAGLKK